MKVEPSAADLLDIARATILAEIAPALPEAQRYAALMVANALAIACRDLAASDTSAGAEIARISSLLVGWTPSSGDEARALREGTAQLAVAIREGRFNEGDACSRLLGHLRETTRSRLVVSNPKAIAKSAT